MAEKRVVALVLAGGVGRRVGASTPKQFLRVAGRPILVHTLSAFAAHPLVSAIAVVCVAGWEEEVRGYAATYGLDKLRWVFPGGATVQESLRNGVYALAAHCSADDIVVIHDGIRPLVDATVLSSVLATAQEYGAAVSSLPYNEQIFLVADDDAVTTTRYIPRETLRRVSTPQAYRYSLLLSKYREAFARGIGLTGSAYTNTMMVDLGVRLHFAAGSDKNIKITTADDLALFEAYMRGNIK